MEKIIIIYKIEKGLLIRMCEVFLRIMREDRRGELDMWVGIL